MEALMTACKSSFVKWPSPENDTDRQTDRQIITFKTNEKMEQITQNPRDQSKVPHMTAKHSKANAGVSKWHPMQHTLSLDLCIS
jgi:endo-beta-N-acetylglucosaminidase D